VKYAASLDGKIATGSGDSRWITGEAARKQVHTMRYLSDAVMVGINTVLADNPQLTVRCSGRGGVTRKQPLRVVVDGKGRTPLTAQLLKEPGKALIALGRKATADEKEAFSRAGAELLELPGDNGLVNLEELMRLLGKRAVTSVLVEGGGVLNSALFSRNMVDKVVAFIAPMIIGGEKAKTPVAGTGFDRINDAIRLKHVSVERFDDDLMVSGYVEK
jgi:diaminohydroxyphosphoribosylaminopyrimidine deaminase/5-amino-6-(5-phosphoribosylamino)uracil reductase